MGLARSGGPILYDLATKVDDLVQTRERYGALLYSHFVDKGDPTPHFHRIFDIMYPFSMVIQNPVSFTASIARVATVEILGELSAHQTNSNKG